MHMSPMIEVLAAASAPWAPAVDGWAPRWAWRVRYGCVEVTGACNGRKQDAQAKAHACAQRLHALRRHGEISRGYGNLAIRSRERAR